MHLCTFVSEEGGDEEDTVSGDLYLMTYTIKYISLADIDTLCQAAHTPTTELGHFHVYK